jgi:methylated-DNA-[protein]-cysteine S-methyltransferase
MLHYHTMETPVGPLTVVLSDAGAVRASGFTADVGDLLPLIHPRFVEPTRAVADAGAVGAAVRSYFDGDLSAIDTVIIEQHTGGAFLAHSWQVMRQIKPGLPVTYTQFAELAGRPTAIRAAAAACARNAAALFAPCHRVLGTDGTLRGYRWGLAVKSRLLAHEKAA